MVSRIAQTRLPAHLPLWSHLGDQPQALHTSGGQFSPKVSPPYRSWSLGLRAGPCVSWAAPALCGGHEAQT